MTAAICLIIAALALLCIPDSPHESRPELFGIPVVLYLLVAALAVSGVVKKWARALLEAWHRLRPR